METIGRAFSFRPLGCEGSFKGFADEFYNSTRVLSRWRVYSFRSYIRFYKASPNDLLSGSLGV